MTEEMKELSQDKCAVIIVTHNSQAHLPKCLDALKKQTHLPSQILVIDSGSKDTLYLQDTRAVVHLAYDNIGFCKANNDGFTRVDPSTKYVLFLNPDAFLTPTFIAQAIHFMNQTQNSRVGALSGVLLGYDLARDEPSGLIDSTGIFRSLLGRWFDRHQKQPIEKINELFTENVPALCGALMFCRRSALIDSQLSANEVMDTQFFMYKEDIDLSCRLRKKGWTLQVNPALVAYHCRGWKKNRKHMSKDVRLLSARNEMRLHARMRSPYYLVSCIKWLYVNYYE